MCGICGAVAFDSPAAPDLDLLRSMVSRIRHRGPDSTGGYRDQVAALGTVRLAIVDPAGGAQPLANEDGSIWVVYNGEVYNYVELGQELAARGHVLKTRTDTEVVVHAYEEWGPECFRRFNGQWAVALWDRRKQQLLLCRDRFGVRPLYVVNQGGRVVFASEIKAIFADPSVRRELDPEGLAQVFTFWCPVAPKTPFREVRQLRPAHYALFDRSGYREVQYWEVPLGPQGGGNARPLEETAAELRERLETAVRLRLTRSDVPVGAYISGGIDSAVVATLGARFSDTRLTTFSIGFEAPEYDEGSYQQQVVDSIRCRHTRVSVSARDIGEAFPRALWHAEHPMMRSAPVPLYVLSEAVRAAGYKVVLTGEGADEVLAGYDIFREAAVRAFWSRDQGSTKRGPIVELLYPWMERSPARTPHFAQAFFSSDLRIDDPAFSHTPRWRTSSMLTRLLRDDLRRSVESADVVSGLLGSLPPGFSDWSLLDRGQLLEMRTLLSGYILSSQGDRMLMAHSVEGRFPFLDHGIAEFACALPPQHKLLGLSGKHILKRAFEGLIPAGVLRRPKQPYSAPDAASLFPEKPIDWVDDLLSEASLREAGLFEPKAVQGLADKCRESHGKGVSNVDNMRAVAVASTMLVYRQFVRGGGADGKALPALDMLVDMTAGVTAAV